MRHISVYTTEGLWVAHDDLDESIRGCGSTRAEAVLDLIEKHGEKLNFKLH